MNAEDFGFTRAHRHGILTATTLMANGEALEARVGCHLALVGGESLDQPGTTLPATVATLIRAIAERRVRVEAELERQFARILEAGIRPTHPDTHKQRISGRRS